MTITRVMTYLATFGAGALAFAAVGTFQAAGSSSQSIEQAAVSERASGVAQPVAPEQELVPTQLDESLAADSMSTSTSETSAPVADTADSASSVATVAGEKPQASQEDRQSGTVTEIGSLQRNTRVVIEGVVARASEEDEFVLQDATGSVQVYTGTSFFVAEPGEKVRVSGFVDESLVLEVYAQEVFHSDGRVTKISY